MPEEVMIAIIRKCLQVDTLAAETYRRLHERFAGDELAAFWRRMAGEEREHVEFWQALLGLALEGLIPQVFEEPYQVLQELEGVEGRVRHLQAQFLEPAQVNLAFVLAYRLEFYLLHPAFAALFNYAASLGQIKGLHSPEESYEAHIVHFMEALGRWGRQSPELELTGEVLVRLWRENRQLAQQSTTDHLTQVLNRRGFFQVVQPLLHLAKRHGQRVGLLMADLDGFKAINDLEGHQAGDLVLRQVAAVISRDVRASDIVGRYGGDEFVIYLGPCEPEGLATAAEKIRLAVQKAPWEGRPVTMSLGGALGLLEPGVEQALERLIKQADQHLLAAKAAGRNQCLTSEEALPASGAAPAREIW